MSQTNDTDTMTSSSNAADITDQTLADDSIEDILPGGDNMTDAPDSLRAQIAEANRRADEAQDSFLRSRAEFANFKRRTEEEREGLRQHLSRDLLERMLPIVDNFERALQAASQTSDFDKLVTGVNAVYRQMQDLLSREGVAPIEALYQPFDPNLHNAVQREETTEHPDNTVVAELQKGYTLQGRVLRPTLVKVATGTE